MRRTGARFHRTLPHFPLANSGSKSIKNYVKYHDIWRQASKSTNFFLLKVGFMKLCPRQAQEFFSESWLASSQICPSSPPSSWDTKWAPTRNSRMCFCFFPFLLFFSGRGLSFVRTSLLSLLWESNAPCAQFFFCFSPWIIWGEDFWPTTCRWKDEKVIFEEIVICRGAENGRRQRRISFFFSGITGACQAP